MNNPSHAPQNPDRARKPWLIAAATTSGLLFGFGLVAGGMTSPTKVLAFLDVAGNWDPSLACVMLGAIAVGFVAFRIAEQRSKTLLGGPLSLPDKSPITKRLVVGSALFGVGWGLSGLCPGPALMTLSLGTAQAFAFVAAFLIGLKAVDGFDAVTRTRGTASSVARKSLPMHNSASETT